MSTRSAGSDASFLSLKRPILSFTEVINKSKFIVFAGRARSEAEAFSFIATHRDDKATHNCWAFRLSPNVYRFSDDGEPAGNSWQTHSDGDRRIEVEMKWSSMVTRHFGGIKLGTGGLIRAYQGSARNALQAALVDPDAHLSRFSPTVCLIVSVPIRSASLPYRFAQQYSGSISEYEGAPLIDGRVDGGADEDAALSMASFSCTVPAEHAAAFQLSMQNACKGQAVFHDLAIDT